MNDLREVVYTNGPGNVRPKKSSEVTDECVVEKSLRKEPFETPHRMTRQ